MKQDQRIIALQDAYDRLEPISHVAFVPLILKLITLVKGRL
jgi:hypothetical protein